MNNLINDNVIIKKTKNNGILEITEIYKDDAKNWIIKNHYSKTWNTSFGIINFGIYKNNILMGIAVYGNLMNPASHKNISDYGIESILELNRLHISDELVKNAETTFLAATFKLIKKIKPDVKFIHTFADGRLGCGTIYKAANFQYCGEHETKFYYHNKTKTYFHNVPFDNTKRPKSMLKLNRYYIDNELETRIVKTYRYIYNLYKKYNNRLPNIKYPKYDIGYDIIIEKPNYNLLMRLYLMYSFINDNEYAKKSINILSSYNVDIEKLKETQLKNKNLISFFKSKLSKKLKTQNSIVGLSNLI